jgi:hypothetical protein
LSILHVLALFHAYKSDPTDEPYGQRSADEKTARMNMLMQYFAGKMAQQLKQIRIVFFRLFQFSSIIDKNAS